MRRPGAALFARDLLRIPIIPDTLERCVSWRFEFVSHPTYSGSILLARSESRSGATLFSFLLSFPCLMSLPSACPGHPRGVGLILFTFGLAERQSRSAGRSSSFSFFGRFK